MQPVGLLAHKSAYRPDRSHEPGGCRLLPHKSIPTQYVADPSLIQRHADRGRTAIVRLN